MFKLRLRYSKIGLVRFISHRDLMRVFFRAFSRANLPVSYSQGFSPHPRVEFCPPLKVGMEGLKELMDVRLSQPVKAKQAISQLNKVMPEGIRINDAKILPDGAPSLGKSIEQAEYRLFLSKDSVISQKEIENFLSTSEFWVEKQKKGEIKKINVRKGVADLKLVQDNKPHLLLTLSLKENIRPQDVLVALSGKELEELVGLKWQRLRFLGGAFAKIKS